MPKRRRRLLVLLFLQVAIGQLLIIQLLSLIHAASATTISTALSAASGPDAYLSSSGRHHSGSLLHLHLCSHLPHQVAKQLRLCKLIQQSSRANDAVARGAARGLAECRHLFRGERWNCTHQMGDQQLLTGELAHSVGTREGAFLQAIAAAGIVHSVASACSAGDLSDCTCDKARVMITHHKLEDEKWKWGGCSHNIRHGMIFAKHLVELLDTFHLFASLPIEHSSHYDRFLKKRAVGLLTQNPQQTVVGQQQRSYQVNTASGKASQQQQQQQQNQQFCHQNQSSSSSNHLSKSIHLKLISSLLGQNSLEKHQEFRLAMNMHNNRVGRMAVAHNMEFRCRCHGLSGSCSMKTCWLLLPSFQVIGAHLKKKYDSSIHLPSVVDVNKLMLMMDRNEVSSILSSDLTSSARETSASPTQNSHQIGNISNKQQQQVSAADTPERFALIGNRVQLTAHLLTSNNNNKPIVGHNTQQQVAPAHFTYYERLKGQQQLVEQQQQQVATTTSKNQTVTSDEFPVNVAPLSQIQYQSFLREMKLCNTTSATRSTDTNYLSHYENNNSNNFDNLGASKKPALTGGGKQLSKQQIQLHQLQLAQQIKSANQHLAQVLHSINKDDLIHLHKSPDYCEPISSHGYAGIQGRVCSENPSTGSENCDKLCCSRGYTMHTSSVSYNCDCTFQFCCSIQCSTCRKESTRLICK